MLRIEREMTSTNRRLTIKLLLVTLVCKMK